MKIAKVIVTEPPLPFKKNGSWTQRLEFFLKSKHNNIDYLICGKTAESLPSSTKTISVEQNSSKWARFLFPSARYKNYVAELKKLSEKNDCLIICVIDNLKLKKEVSNFIKEDKKNHRLVFYSCGFSYFLTPEKQVEFMDRIDEMIFLTNASYHFNKERYEQFIPEASILNNPIDKSIFSVPSDEEKMRLKKKYEIKEKTIFLWLSHDREKKGLHLILNAWKDWHGHEKNALLIVVGAMRSEKISGVAFLGEKNADIVPEYFKIADIYLFPTLWKEGFGLSLAQAICCGCFSIAADNGGVKDFFKPSHGILIGMPNLIAHWTDAMQEAHEKINAGWQKPIVEKGIMDYGEWSIMFAQIFSKWENRIKK